MAPPPPGEEAGAEESFDVANATAAAPPPTRPREVHLILDHTAFVLGLGNVKRWFNDEFAASQLRRKGEAPEQLHLNFYVPAYTLHELEYVRRGVSVLALNARELVMFIDHLCDMEAQQDHTGRLPLLFSVFLEDRNAQFPSWDTCLKYRTLEQQALALSEQKPPPTVPPRLRHLIRSCVFMRHMPPGHQPVMPGPQWKLVTEDAHTRAWALRFGVDCLNVNEAELLLFHARDLSSFVVKQPGSDFSADSDMYDQVQPSLLHRKLDTTKYAYERLLSSGHSKKKKGKAKPEKPVQQVQPQVVYTTAAGEPHKEDFNMINYAPRTGGKLWQPQKKGKAT